VEHRPFIAFALASVLLGACTAEEPPTPVPRDGNLEWTAKAPAPTARTEVTAAAVGPRIFVVGGFAENRSTVATVEIYDAETDSWSEGPDLPIGVNHPMSTVLDGTVYVLGGYLGPSLTNPTRRAFALREGRWVELPRMPEPRAAGGAAAAGRRIYVVGGVGPDGLADATLVFDPSSGRWTSAPAVPTRREHLGVAAFDGHVYAVGGRARGIGNLTAAEAFDPERGGWRRLDAMPSARGGIAAAATANGFIVAPGGEADRAFDTVEAFDVESGEWIVLPPMPTPRHGLGVVAVGTVVLVVAGGPSPGFAFSSANEALDLAPLREIR
jgi:N-acetylneuraminic acid mutarotase